MQGVEKEEVRVRVVLVGSEEAGSGETAAATGASMAAMAFALFGAEQSEAERQRKWGDE
jgi:hypothetical protein